MYKVSTFADVKVLPFSTFYTNGRPIVGGPDWPDWEERTFERHVRFGRPSDQRPVAEKVRLMDGNFAPPEVLDFGPAYWCGMIIGHFGHFISEFAMRIVPSRTVDPRAKLVFVARMVNPPLWFWQIIDWCGVPREDVVIIREPTILRSLSVVEQPEHIHGVAPTSHHLDMMDRFVAGKGLTLRKDARPVFVSRAGLDHAKAKFAGESYLESCLEQAGFLVFRPETASILDQLQLYVTSPFVTFSEGSALHLCQLAGRSFGRVGVLRRRDGKSHFAPSMEPRCREYVEVMAARQMIMGTNEFGNPKVHAAMTIMDVDAVMDDLDGVRSGVRACFGVTAFRRAEKSDVTAWVDANTCQREQANWQDNDRLIAQTLTEAGFAGLAVEVRERAGVAGD